MLKDAHNIIGVITPTIRLCEGLDGGSCIREFYIGGWLSPVPFSIFRSLLSFQQDEISQASDVKQAFFKR